jgi:hypothetical protein
MRHRKGMFSTKTYCMCCMEQKQTVRTCGHDKCTYKMCDACIDEWALQRNGINCPHCRKRRVVTTLQTQQFHSRPFDLTMATALYWLWGYLFLKLFFPISSNRIIVHLFLGVMGSVGFTFAIAGATFVYHIILPQYFPYFGIANTMLEAWPSPPLEGRRRTASSIRD